MGAQLVTALDEPLVTSCYLDTLSVLPSSESPEDCAELVHAAIRERKAPSSSQAMVPAD